MSSRGDLARVPGQPERLRRATGVAKTPVGEGATGMAAAGCFGNSPKAGLPANPAFKIGSLADPIYRWPGGGDQGQGGRIVRRAV